MNTISCVVNQIKAIFTKLYTSYTIRIFYTVFSVLENMFHRIDESMIARIYIEFECNLSANK